MEIHSMRLQERPFERVRTGIKKVECRINDAKRQAVEVGDELVFSHMEDAGRVIRTRVVKRVDVASFVELFESMLPEDLGYESIDAENLATQMHKYYDEEVERRLGVVGFYVEVLEGV